MRHAKNLAAVALGASGVKLAEFQIDQSARLKLTSFALRPFSSDRLPEARREQETIAALREAKLAARRAHFCVSGAFTKFVKLPPVDTAKIRQIIQYEAQQQIPYALEEAVWDFQITRNDPAAETEVLLAAMKAGAVESLFRAAEAAGLRMELTDAPIAALANSFLYNYPDADGCSLLVDIGAKSTHVLLLEKGRFFARSINLGSANITQEFSAEAKLPFAKAEQFKIERGFVSLGGAYEDPEDPQEAALSKIARQVMTRLHAQILQTIQFHRSQHGGGTPQRILLAGGGSLLPYTGNFFAEKLELPVERFNPLRNIEADESVAPEAATHLGELVGIALRDAAKCPVELNLMPKAIAKRQMFREKRPYFIATFLALLAGLGANGYFYSEVAAMKRDVLTDLRSKVEPLKARAEQLNRTEKAIAQAKTEAEVYTRYLKNRFFWAEGLVEMRDLLIDAEEKMARPGRPAGVWIEEFGVVPQDYLEEEGLYSLDKPQQQTPFGPFGAIGSMPPEYIKRLYPQIYAIMEKAGMFKNLQAGPLVAPKTNTNLVTINVKFRAVNLADAANPAANSDLVYVVADNFKKSDMFDPEGTKLTGDLEQPEMTDQTFGTFGFGMTLKLKNDLQM